MEQEDKRLQSWKKRGYILEEDLIKYENLNYLELKQLLTSLKNYERTIAIRLLASKYYMSNEDELSSLFITVIEKDKALYTRIEAQKALATGSVISIKKLCTRINKTNNKQHVKLPSKANHKKTYPIARDIPIRILEQMGKTALEELKIVIADGDENIIKEAFDGVGYILYHNQEIDDHTKYLIDMFEKYESNDVILWKIIRAMSGTKSNKIKNFLLSYKPRTLRHKEEIDRTISFINKK